MRFLLKGMSQRMSNSFDAALGTFDQIIALAPADAEAHYQKGITLVAKKDVERRDGRVRGGGRERSRVRPTSAWNWGRCTSSRACRERAVEQYQAALRYVPDYAPAVAALQRLGVE